MLKEKFPSSRIVDEDGVEFFGDSPAKQPLLDALERLRKLGNAGQNEKEQMEGEIDISIKSVLALIRPEHKDHLNRLTEALSAYSKFNDLKAKVEERKEVLEERYKEKFGENK